MPKQTIFLTGATGKIGDILLKDLVNEDYRIIALSRKKPVNYVDNPKIKYVCGDILNPDSYAADLKGVDMVLHMAAITHTNNIGMYHKINSAATSDLIKKCKESGVKRLIFISTRAISKDGGHYSRSKLIAERYVEGSGLDWVIIRLSEVYGIDGESGVSMILNNIENLPFIPVVGNGEYKIAPVHISDVLFAINQVIKKSDIKGKIYNIAGPESFTFNEFIDRVLKIKKLKKFKIHMPVFLIRVCAYILSFFGRSNFFVIDQLPRFFSEKSDDISMAVNELGFKPAALEERLAWK